MWALPPKPVLAFTAASVAFSILSKIFGFYYVMVFLDFYHIDNSWFQFAQVLFMIWNTLNDPLFAYIQDNSRLPFVKTRRHAILYSGPLFGLVFLVPWFPWEAMGTGSWVTGLHLIAALCLYDTMYTFVGLAQSCLFAEISKNHEDRVQLLRWSKLGAFSASLALYLCEFSSASLKYFGYFQLSCVCLAVISSLLYKYAGTHAKTQYDTEAEHESDTARSTESIWLLTWQILKSRNFLCFVTVNFCHIFHGTFLGSFLPIIAQNLAPPEVVPPTARRALYGVKDIFPSARIDHVTRLYDYKNELEATLLVIFGASMITDIGYYKLIRLNFILKITFGFVLYLFGINHPWLLLVIMIVDGGLGSATFSMFSMALSDIAEEDKMKYHRRLPITSMVFGTNAVIVKSVYSLSPMVVVAVLNMYKYTQFKQDPTSLSPQEITSLKSAMFYLVCFIPMVVGSIQLFAWSQYTLSETHKVRPKTVKI